MQLCLVVEQKTNERGKFKVARLVCVRSDGSQVVLTYDRTMIANVLDVAPSRVTEYDVGTYSLGKE